MIMFDSVDIYFLETSWVFHSHHNLVAFEDVLYQEMEPRKSGRQTMLCR